MMTFIVVSIIIIYHVIIIGIGNTFVILAVRDKDEARNVHCTSISYHDSV